MSDVDERDPEVTELMDLTIDLSKVKKGDVTLETRGTACNMKTDGREVCRMMSWGMTFLLHGEPLLDVCGEPDGGARDECDAKKPADVDAFAAKRADAYTKRVLKDCSLGHLVGAAPAPKFDANALDGKVGDVSAVTYEELCSLTIAECGDVEVRIPRKVIDGVLAADADV